MDSNEENCLSIFENAESYDGENPLDIDELMCF